MNFFYLFLFLFLWVNCSLLEKKNSEFVNFNMGKRLEIFSYNKQYSNTIVDDLRWLESSSVLNSKLPPLWKQHLKKNLISEVLFIISNIDISKYNCTSFQVACVYPSNKSTVFLTPKFFNLSKPERISTLFHEAYHHHNGYYHTKCIKYPKYGYDCDNSEYSAYGIEIFILNKLKANSSNIKKHINNKFL